MSDLNLPNLKHLEGKPLPGRKTYEIKGSEFVEVTRGGLEDAFNMLKSPEAEVNPRYRAIVSGFSFIKNAILQTKAALRHSKGDEESARLKEALNALYSAHNEWPIKLPPNLTDSKPSQTPPNSVPQASEHLEESQQTLETLEQTDQGSP